MVDLHAITPLALDTNFNQDGVFIPFSDEIIVMQSTGLLDKNGKEIYEQDLLWNGKYYPDTGERVLHTVEWANGSYFAFTQMGKSQAHESTFMGKSTHEWKDCEIIGNIYENPDTLPTP